GARTIGVGDRPPVLGDRVVRAVREALVGREAVVEAVVRRGQHVALFVGEELLDRIGLLDVRDVPVPNALPRRVRVAAEHQLTARGVDLQELGAVGVAAEGQVDDQARGNLFPAGDDLGLVGENLAHYLGDRLGRVPTDWGPGARLGGRSDLLAR